MLCVVMYVGIPWACISLFRGAGIGNALAMRELLAELRITGEVTGGAPPFSAKERERFTNALNRMLTRMRKR